MEGRKGGREAVESPMVENEAVVWYGEGGKGGAVSCLRFGGSCRAALRNRKKKEKNACEIRRRSDLNQE